MSTLLLNISEAEIARLNYERYNYPSAMIQKRIYSLYLKATLGWSNSSISMVTGLSSNRISFWIKQYQKGGFNELIVNNYGTNISELSNHATSLLSSFEQKPPMTAIEAAERIFEATGIIRSEQQVRVFMKRHGLKFIKCGHIPSKANNEAQHE